MEKYGSDGSLHPTSGIPDASQLYAQLITFPILNPLVGNHYHPDAKSDSSRTKPVLAISANDKRFLHDLGGGALPWESLLAKKKSAQGSVISIDNISGLNELVDKLISTSRAEHKPLGDVYLISHGSPGHIALGKNDYYLYDEDVIGQFARLQPHMAKGSKIVFAGCEVSDPSNPYGRKALQALADATNSEVKAFDWVQPSGIAPSWDGIGPGVDYFPRDYSRVTNDIQKHADELLFGNGHDKAALYALHKDAQQVRAKGLDPIVLNLKLKELESKKHLPAVGISDDGSITAIKDFPEKHSMRIVETGPQNYTTVDDGTDDKTLLQRETGRKM